MKFMAMPLVLLFSLSSFAGNNSRIISINEPNGEVRIVPKGDEFAEFEAQNPTCIEMQPTHVFPIPVAKSVREDVSFSKSGLSFKPASKGYCLYSFRNTFLRIGLDKGYQAHIEIYQDDNAPDTTEITCKRKLSEYDQLNCSADGNEFTYNLHVYFNMKSKEPKEIKINMID
jgi:hypothetical protein